MLSAFTARPIIELKQRDKSKIETILAHGQGDRVFAGLNTGSLRIYRLTTPPLPTESHSGPANGSSSPTKSSDSTRPSSSSAEPAAPQKAPPKPSELLREAEKFSTRSIEQLAIIKEANTLVSLSNYHVSLHDLGSYEPLPGAAPLTQTKNATCFAVTSNIFKDGPEGIPEIISRLAVAVKRRLLIWRWHDMELDDEVVEIALSESIRSISWANATKLVCGMNGGFDIVDVLTREVSDIVGPGAIGGSGQAAARFGAASMGYMGLGGYVPKPLATKLAEGQMLLAKDINTLFITDKGMPFNKRQIPWQTAPESIGYNYPYILALHAPAKGLLEVRNPDTLSLLQSISLPGAAQLHFAPPTVSLTHAAKGFHVSSERCVWKMEATDYDTQVGELVEKEKYDEAISVLNMLEDALLKNKSETLREVKMLKAELLFEKKKFRDSMDLFNEDEVHAPPERVLKLFPRNIAGELSRYHEPSESEPESERESDAEVDGENKKNGERGPKLDASEVTASPSRGGFSRLLYGRQKADSDAASIASSKRPEVDDAASIKTKPAEEASLEGKELMYAVRELNSYLAGTRARLQRVIDPVTGKLKPRKAKNGTSVDPFVTLFGVKKEDSDEKLEQELRDTFKLVDTTLFRSYMFSQPTLAGSLFRIPNFCDPDVVNEKLLEHSRYNELVDFFYGKKLHRQALELLKTFGSSEEPNELAPTLHGPRRTVVYMQNLSPDMIDLILEFSEWTLRADPGLGMEVFVADSQNSETLPRDRVVEFLSRIDVELEIQYLDHIITELNDMTPDFHNRLVELIIAQLKVKTAGDEGSHEISRLVRFLRDSNQYSLSKAFSLIPRDDPGFYEAQAVVLSGMQQHKQALEVYVFKMNDYYKAEEYCNCIHKSQEGKESSAPEAAIRTFADGAPEANNGDDSPSIYRTLLSLYLTPPPPHKPNLQPALDLLSRHGSRLPAASTLSLIPDDLPVKDLASYFRGRIRSANSVVNESRVIAGLRHTLLIDSQAFLLLGDGLPGGQGGRNRRVVINEERVCGVCHKRLGGSVVAIMPDNTVVHYGCRNRTGSGGGVGSSRDRALSSSGFGGGGGGGGYGGYRSPL
ncbi:vacuolar sorting protein 39 domain 1 [Zalerion maritima]|uniref:Vacuolar sorting protein 39 domain 1 n=1 Tax=Zalerion maritima TaxID=339359 RepID=A0AAD5RFL5_9PEZI|nr:vacuolar sorting protein 39 domain 1 [Zalerion maritima]